MPLFPFSLHSSALTSSIPALVQLITLRITIVVSVTRGVSHESSPSATASLNLFRSIWWIRYEQNISGAGLAWSALDNEVIAN